MHGIEDIKKVFIKKELHEGKILSYHVTRGEEIAVMRDEEIAWHSYWVTAIFSMGTLVIRFVGIFSASLSAGLRRR